MAKRSKAAADHSPDVGNVALTERQKRFVLAFRECGNATEASRRAGYTGGEAALAVTGSRMLRLPKVRAQLDKLEAQATSKGIADADEINEFWTTVMRDAGAEPRDRLKASELRAKAAAMFIERVEQSGPGGKPIGVVVLSIEDALSGANEEVK